MAKPVQPANLSAEMAGGAAAARILDAKQKEVWAFVEPAMTGDVEGIHDLRVAAKRLREAMRLFRPLLPKRRGRELLVLVDELNDALGQVRDRDVLAEHARSVREQVAEAAEFIDALLETWAAERAAYFGELAALWDRLATSDRLARRLRELASATRNRQRAVNRVPLDRFAYASILTRLDRVRQHLRKGGSLDNPATLHRLRILIKRLKYSMEPFLTVFPALEGPYAPVAEAQETLGLTHDFDVLHAAFLERSKGRRRKSSRAALDFVAEHRSELLGAAQGPVAILRSEAWQRSLLDGID
jgi:CHAD domain-containing protein